MSLDMLNARRVWRQWGGGARRLAAYREHVAKPAALRALRAIPWATLFCDMGGRWW